MNRWMRAKPVSISAQALHLNKDYPGSRSICHKGMLTWNGVVSARRSSGEYHLRMTYRPGERPRVQVVEPDLKVSADGRKIPHLFSQEEQSLCLHFIGVWKPTMLLAKSIVPWAVLWTEYFEWWLFTDEWAGEEIDHSGTK